MRYVTGLPGEERRRKRLMFMLQAFIDDSGTKGQAAAAVLAGFVAPAENWASFSDAWWKELPDGRPFKMQQGKRQTARIQKLSDLIVRNATLRIECAVNIADYEEIVRGRVPRIMDNHFFPAFHFIISRLAHYLTAAGATERFDIIFDKHSKFVPARKWYCMAKDLVPEGCKAILPIDPHEDDDAEFMPLQAADMFAWTVRRSHDDGAEDWEWLTKKFDTIKAVPSPPLEKDALRNYVAGQEQQINPELLKKWEEECGNFEYEAFDRTVTDLLKVPHSEIKKKLDAEKRAKKRKKSKPSSASREGADR